MEALHLAAAPAAGLREFDYFHPAFLYESIWDLAMFILLVAWLRPRLREQPGALFFAYIGVYSIGRFLIEGIRLDSFWVGPFRVAQLASLSGVLVAGRGPGLDTAPGPARALRPRQRHAHVGQGPGGSRRSSLSPDNPL